MTENGHCKLAMSSAHRWLECPGSIHMEELHPEVGQSKYAAEGSQAHAVAEAILTDALSDGISIEDAWERHKTEAKDEEMAEHVLGYCKAARGLLPLKPERIAIERKFMLSDVLDIGGTADFCFVATNKAGQRVGVILDFKYGQGIAVEAEGNPQCCGYAAAMHKTEDWGPLDGAAVYIYQPRADHPDGPLRRMSLTRRELDDWVEKLFLGGAAVAESLKKEPRVYNPGDHCRWCRGEAVCLANQKFLTGLADVDFAPATMPTPPMPEELNPEQIGRIIKYRSGLESFFKRVEEYAVAEMMFGRHIPGVKLVKGRVNRQWINDVEKIAAELIKMGIADPWKKGIKGITEVERQIGKGKIGELTETPEPSLRAAPVEDKRAAVTPGETLPELDFEF